MDIKMRIVDYTISEKGNSYIALRKVVWGDKDDDSAKYDLRKYYTNADGTERMSKGVCFDEEAADELVRVLVDTGHGNTRELIDVLRNRNDFEESYNNTINNIDDLGGHSENFVDIRSEMMG